MRKRREEEGRIGVRRRCANDVWLALQTEMASEYLYIAHATWEARKDETKLYMGSESLDKGTDGTFVVPIPSGMRGKGRLRLKVVTMCTRGEYRYHPKEIPRAKEIDYLASDMLGIFNNRAANDPLTIEQARYEVGIRLGQYGNETYFTSSSPPTAISMEVPDQTTTDEGNVTLFQQCEDRLLAGRNLCPTLVGCGCILYQHSGHWSSEGSVIVGPADKEGLIRLRLRTVYTNSTGDCIVDEVMGLSCGLSLLLEFTPLPTLATPVATPVATSSTEGVAKKD